MSNYISESVCPLDCADTCSLQVEVEGNRVTRVRGSKQNPFTNGKICSKVAKGFTELVHGKHRLTHPLKRIDSDGSARFERISWEEAYSTIHHQFKSISEQYGAEAILPLKYAGPMGLVAGSSMDARFFKRLGASQLDSSPLCAGVSAAAWQSIFGAVGGIDYEEMAQSKLIVIWANNITVGHLHLIKIIRQARRDGAKVVVIDPKRIRIADDADLFLQIKPGTDVILAYAVAALLEKNGGLDAEFLASKVNGYDAFLAQARQWTVDKAAKLCGLDATDIQKFAELWGTVKPASVSIGVALERSRNGGSAVRAVCTLPLLTGNFGQPGAGICKPSAFFMDLDRASLTSLAAPVANTRTLNILDIGQHIIHEELDPPIRGVFVYNHNPVAVHPRQALIREALSRNDVFVVAFDHTFTDSVALADIVLPACTSLEYADVYKAYGHAYLQHAAAVIKPIGESRSNTQVFRELATVFGFDDPEFRQTDQELIAGIHSHLPAPGEISQRKDHKHVKSVFRTCKPATPSGKAELVCRTSKFALPNFKALETKRAFTVISPSSEHRINSTLGGNDANTTPLQVEMSHSDCETLNLQEGQLVKLYNNLGDLVLSVKPTEQLKPGVLCVAKGAWLADSPSHASINLLIPGHKADMGDGACYNDCQVDIEVI